MQLASPLGLYPVCAKVTQRLALIDQEQAGGQGSNTPTVSPASTGRAKGGCLLQGLVGRREPAARIGESSQDTGPRRAWQSTENSSIVGTVPRVRWTGEWLMQDIAGSLPRGVGPEDTEAQEVLWPLLQRRRVPAPPGLLPGRYSHGSHWRSINVAVIFLTS